MSRKNKPLKLFSHPFRFVTHYLWYQWRYFNNLYYRKRHWNKKL